MSTPSTRRYAALAEVEDLVERFEARALARDAWDHAAHLTVGLWYLLCYPEHAATARMIDGIRALNRAHGIRQGSEGGYHETVTLFWLATTRRFLERGSHRSATLELVNAFLAELVPREALILEHYSQARLSSWKARNTWVEPDLRPL